MLPEVKYLLANIEHTHLQQHDATPDADERYSWCEGGCVAVGARFRNDKWHVSHGDRFASHACLRVAYEATLKVEIAYHKAAVEAFEKRYALIQPLSVDEFLDECKAPKGTFVTSTGEGYQTSWYSLPNGQGASARYNKSTLAWDVHLGCAIDGSGATFAEALAEAESKLPKPLTIEQQIEAHFGVPFQGTRCSTFTNFHYNKSGLSTRAQHHVGQDKPWTVVLNYGNLVGTGKAATLTDAHEEAKAGFRASVQTVMEKI